MAPQAIFWDRDNTLIEDPGYIKDPSQVKLLPGVGQSLVQLKRMGYKLVIRDRTTGPINAVFFDWQHGSFWGGSSNHGEDYGIGW